VHNYERTCDFLKQDGATAQSAVWSICSVFGGKIISMGLWPPCLPELNPHDLYWWGLLRDKVCSSNPHTEDSRGESRCRVSVWPAELLTCNEQCVWLIQRICKSSEDISSTLTYSEYKRDINWSTLNWNTWIQMHSKLRQWWWKLSECGEMHLSFKKKYWLVYRTTFWL